MPSMDAIANLIQRLQLHPIVDHFTVALLIVALLIDLLASLTSRAWMRYAALTLMILGALAAGGSYLTGDAETDRIWNTVKGNDEIKAVLTRHAELGLYLAIAFGVLT